ncbi:MAG: TonB-dependent receptor, partial [Hellea sp.]|nr:TonB-dependent receptor [Hellea sp.]
TQADFDQLQTRGLTVPNLTVGSRFARPENSTVYEIGVKAKLDRGYVNVTVFDQTIKGFQSNVFTGTGFNLANAGSQSAQGIEVDFLYSPIDNLSLTGGAIFMDPVYDSFPGAAGPGGTVVDLTGERPGGIHKSSWTLGATYDFTVGGREGFLRADWLHEGETPVAENVLAAQVGGNAFRKVDTVNASAGIDVTDDVSLLIFGRNLFNDEYPLSIFPAVAQAGSFSGYPNAPRTYGASVRFDFD